MTVSYRLPSCAVLMAAHQQTIEIFGGATGAPDKGKLDACIARADQLDSYSEDGLSIHQCAAAIAFAIVKIHHPAPDGNKRLALAALIVTLGLNGQRLDASESDTADVFLGLASGSLDEDGFVEWVRNRSGARSG